ncbi:hypothetical protein AJ78_06865, partial [Emergomyces pasteurianus Ep9510]
MVVVSRKPPVERGSAYWMAMINKVSQSKKPAFEESTKRTLEVIKQSFTKFVQLLEPPDPQYWLKNLTMNVIECFLRWYLDTHNVRSLTGFLVKVRFWRIYYCVELNTGFFLYDLKRQTKH